MSVPAKKVLVFSEGFGQVWGMRIFFLTCLTMIAFAANSVLNRMGLVQAGMDPLTFGTVRLAAGAVTLAILTLVLRGRLDFSGRGRITGVLALLVYIYGFSIAYVALDAGVGALILFGTVQVTMFAGAILARDEVPLSRWMGASLAFGGLAWLLWPAGGAPVPMLHAGFMVAAGVGWGLYSLAGRGVKDALQATAANFILAAPLGFAAGLLRPTTLEAMPASTFGLGLAVASGAVTSGLGYALWYAVLPMLGASRGAVAQLTVPVIAMLGGVLMLAEIPGWRFAVAAVLVLGGVAIAAQSGKGAPR